MWRHFISRLQCLSSMKEAEQALSFITKSGLHNHPSLISRLILFTSLSPSANLTFAHSIFIQTTMDNSFICNTMIRAYSLSVFPTKSIHLYNQMHRFGVTFDSYTYTFALKACARVCKEEGFCGVCLVSSKVGEIHCGVLKYGFCRDCYILNGLVVGYSQCGGLSNARQVFDEMTERSIASWNVMVSAYDQINDFSSADLLIGSMPVKNVVSWNILIARYVRLSDIESAKRVFEEMPERDSVSWNSMISGYVQIKDYAGALNLFREMQVVGVNATEITLTSVLGACAETGNLEIGRKIHGYLKEKYKIEGFLGNALVDMYAKSGSMEWAWEVFNELQMKHVSCWNAMIVGLAIHGYSEEALELFSAMEHRGNEVMPNRVTFIGLLIACSHKGLVEEGRRYFNLMSEEYMIMPDIKHYGCLVDLLSRYGHLSEAHRIIKTMPFDANSIVWRTMLGACRVHGNVELAEESFQQLAKLEPLQDGDYVLLSNTYAEAERWDGVERARNEMIDFGVLKKPGFSHIEIK